MICFKTGQIAELCNEWDCLVAEPEKELFGELKEWVANTLTFGDVIGPKKITEISSLSVK